MKQSATMRKRSYSIPVAKKVVRPANDLTPEQDQAIQRLMAEANRNLEEAERLWASMR